MRVPGAPLTTTRPFHSSGKRITNCASLSQPLWVLNEEVSRKCPSTWMPGTSVGLRVPGACSPDQSAGSV